MSGKSGRPYEAEMLGFTEKELISSMIPDDENASCLAGSRWAPGGKYNHSSLQALK
ncbi:MAG: hypothetical protein ACQEW7_01380 [Pseudomonadota bacterium]